MNTATKCLMRELESVLQAQLGTIRLSGRDKQTIRRAFKREIRPLLQSYEDHLPKAKEYRLSVRGRRKLQESMARTRTLLDTV